MFTPGEQLLFHVSLLDTLIAILNANGGTKLHAVRSESRQPRFFVRATFRERMQVFSLNKHTNMNHVERFSVPCNQLFLHDMKNV